MSSDKISCFRKHIFQNQVYHILIDENNFFLSKSRNKSQAKYILPLNLETIIHFQVFEKQLQAFGFKYQGKLKWFFSTHEILIQFMNLIKGKVYFQDILHIYERRSILGRGASSQVLLFQNKLTNEQVACKIITKSYLNQKGSNERMIRMKLEIEILQKINHPNLIKLLEIYEGEQAFYLLNPYLMGETLNQYQKKSLKLRKFTIQRIMKNILEGLSYLHKMGIIHRDLKLDNIVFEKQDEINSLKIIDFGLAIYEKDNHRLCLCGTPGYIAPEAMAKQEVAQLNFFTTKCDMFGVGVIFFKLLTGQNIFSGQTTNEIIEQSRNFDFNKINWALKDIPSDTYKLLEALLQKNPTNRPSAIEALNFDYFLQLEQRDTSQTNTYDFQTKVDSLRTFRTFKKIEKWEINDRYKNFSIEQENRPALIPQQFIVNQSKQNPYPKINQKKDIDQKYQMESQQCEYTIDQNFLMDHHEPQIYQPYVLENKIKK